MSYTPTLTHGDRRYRQEKIIATYLSGANSRQVASQFGVSDSHVRMILRREGVSRAPGRPKR